MKVLVLSSGGLDSTVCVGIAVNLHGAANVVTASIIYGQRHEKEMLCADDVALFYGVKHYVLDLSGVFQFSDCSILKRSSKKIVHGSYAEQIAKTKGGRVETYVPFRNGLMLSTAAALADSLFPGEECEILYGAHADDAVGNAYADCSPAFSAAMGKAVQIGTYGKIKVYAPLIDKTKAEVVKIGARLGVPFELTWSCYVGGEKPCGKCGTCIDRAKAFEINGLKDPAIK